MISTGHARTCRATTKRGSPCQAKAVHGSDFCYMHDPALAGERASARKRGGQARHGRAIRHLPGEPETWPVNTIEDIRALLEWAIADLLTMERSIKRTIALASLIRAAVTVNEQTELAERIAALEERLEGAPVGAMRSNGNGYR